MAELMYIKFLDRLFRQRVLMHVLFWTAVTGFFYLVFRDENRSAGRTLIVNLGFLPGHLIFAYSMMYWVIPRFLLKRKMALSVTYTLLFLAAGLFYLRLADTYLVHYSRFGRIWVPRSFPRSIFALFSVAWIAVSIKLAKYWYREKEIQQRLEREKLTVELQLLKAQLHPHFLFNTLNNLYSLTLESSPQAPRAVLQLSSLLRYMLYECNEPVTLLTKEIGMLRIYLALEKSRYRGRLEISASFTGDIADQLISPLLLLPFVENAVKHGTRQELGQCWISLQLHVERRLLTFKLTNSSAASKSMEGEGLGLQNVRRRLEVLYPDHQLKIIPGEDCFTVSLTLPVAPVDEQQLFQSSRTYFYETEMPVGG